MLDSSRIERAFGLRPTPLEEIVRATVRWFRGQEAGAGEEAAEEAA